MKKRIVALALCLIMLLGVCTACSHGEQDKGAYIRMYLAEKIYDFDPLAAYNNAEALQIVDLLFEGLFEADENGKPQKALVDKYDYVADDKEGTYTLTLELKETHWSDGTPLTSTHAQFAFRRLFSSDVSHPATALLYDIKNARKIANGEIGYSVDDLKVSASDPTTLEIEFEHNIDVDNFLVTLCSPALYPMRDDIVEFNSDWAKSTTSLYCSGPFMVRAMNYEEKDGFVLERNSYYYRKRSLEKSDRIDKYVTPFRLVCDYTTPFEDQLAAYNSKEAGALYYLGSIPVASRTTLTEEYAKLFKKADITDAPSTHVLYFNTLAKVGDTQLFANADVRRALSLAIDREAIAEALVLAEAADALVPKALLYRADKTATFRDKAAALLSTSADVEAAEALLEQAGINAKDYSFTIKVAAYKTDHVLAAEMAAAAWEELGFKVTVEALEVEPIYNEDGDATGAYSDPYATALSSGDFQVIALDLVSVSTDAFGYLAPFAMPFSGNAMAVSYDEKNGYQYNVAPHVTGYNDAAYNTLIEAAFNTYDYDARAEMMVEAEEMLLDDMPVIPVVYNKTFSLASSKLGKIDSGFYSVADFTKTKLPGYWKIALAEGFVTEDEK